MHENRDEVHTENWLRSQGYTNIVKLPRGCDPPDFEVTDGRKVYGVEVRRLDQIVESPSGDSTQVETYDRSLYDNITKVLHELNASSRTSDCNCTCYVSFGGNGLNLVLNRKDKQEIRNQIKEIFSSVYLKEGESWIFNLSEYGLNIRLNLTPRCNRHCTSLMFKIRSRSSIGGGWGLPKVVGERLLDCIKEKSCKVRKKRCISEYSEWWLILIDYVEYGISDNDCEDLKR